MLMFCIAFSSSLVSWNYVFLMKKDGIKSLTKIL